MTTAEYDEHCSSALLAQGPGSAAMAHHGTIGEPCAEQQSASAKQVAGSAMFTVILALVPDTGSHPHGRYNSAGK